MLSFRYHIVTLVAVFAALAVGVVLGAGPLQTRLAAALTTSTGSSQSVDTAALAEVQRIADADAEGLNSLASHTLSGTLDGLAVATVSLPGTNADDLSAVTDSLTAAGASIVGAASLTDNWQSLAMANYRETLATPLSTHLAALPADATAEATIAFGVVAVLTSTGSETDLVKEILTDESTPILSLDTDPQGGAQAVVVVGPRDSARTGATDAQSASGAASAEAWVGLGRAVGAAPKSGVVVGDAHDASSMVAQLRSQGAAVTTIDTPGSALASLSAAAALVGASAQARAFGVGEGATEAMPALP